MLLLPFSMKYQSGVIETTVINRKLNRYVEDRRVKELEVMNWKSKKIVNPNTKL